jgi:predicted transglutaminase-like cysteine proteinase
MRRLPAGEQNEQMGTDCSIITLTQRLQLLEAIGVSSACLVQVVARKALDLGGFEP